AGAALYRERCASCHDAGLARTPTRDALGHMSGDNIRFALTKGKMSEQAAGLSAAQIEALVGFLTGASASAELSNHPEPTPVNPACKSADTPLPDMIGGPRWNGWGVDGRQHRFQPEDMAKLSAQDVPRLKLKWAFGFPGVGQAYAQPAVAPGPRLRRRPRPQGSS